jgi:outer membrane protein assembly factor BamA
MCDTIRCFSATRRCAGGRVLCLALFLIETLPVTAEPTRSGEIDASAIALPAGLETDLPETSHTRIGSITIENGSIFDLDNPEENKALYRLANRMHVTTRPEVIEQQLLFDTGDIYSPQVIEESARMLRSNRYIQDASIDTTQQEDGVVDVHVKTTDVWTLAPDISLGRSGGKNRNGFGIKETNLFGTGMEIAVQYKSDVDRDLHALKIVDRNIRNSWYGMTAVIENNSDGHRLSLEVDKPFYALDSRSAHGFAFLDDDRIESLYDHGELTAQYRHQSKSHEIMTGWSVGLQDGWSKRYIAGLAYDEHRFSAAEDAPIAAFTMPADRKLLYPFVGIELFQNKFDKAKNLDQIGRVEDRYLGTSINARLGLAQSAMGSDRNAWLASVGAKTSFGDPRKTALFLSSEFAARLESGALNNLTLELNASYYKRQSDKRLFFAHLDGTYGHNLDLDQQVLLGGDSGLRGYPLRYQTGDKRVLLTLEQRIFTDWYPWRLLRVGGALFFDAGRTWGHGSIATGNDGLLKDVGIGLRLGNTRSGLGNVAHIDVAYPLDGNNDISNLQFLVSVKQSF